MTTSERQELHLCTRAAWSFGKKFKKSFDTPSTGLKKKSLFPIYPHVQGVLLEKKTSIPYSAIEEQMQLLCLCLHKPNLCWNEADHCNHQEESKNLTVHLYCFWSKTFNNLNFRNYKSQF